MAVGVKELILCAFLLVLGILMTILAATVLDNKNALVLLPLMFYIAGPMPMVLCGRAKPRQDFMMDGETNFAEAFANFSNFMTGALTTSGPCLALVLYHIGTISGGALLLSFASAAFLCGAMGVIYHALKKPSEDENDFGY
jgi:hypothetical protein